MACDPQSRSPRFYEMSACVNIMPPITSKVQSKTHPRILEVIFTIDDDYFFYNYFNIVIF